MGFLQRFIPPNDRYAALMLYGMVFSTCFNGYDAGIMTVILADKQFIEYYGVDATRSGIIATIPWATTGKSNQVVISTLDIYLFYDVRLRTALLGWNSCQLGRQTLGSPYLNFCYDYWGVSCKSKILKLRTNVGIGLFKSSPILTLFLSLVVSSLVSDLDVFILLPTSMLPSAPLEPYVVHSWAPFRSLGISWAH
jgi:hypothetical protein